MKNGIIFPIFVVLVIFISGCSKDNVSPVSSGTNSFNSLLEGAIESEDSTTNLNISEYGEISGPAVITESGVYTLIADFSTGTSGNGIEIRGCNHVYLDLNGHKINGASGHALTSGVLVDSCEYVLIDNGFIEGYTNAVRFSVSSKCALKDVVVTSGYLGDNSPPPHFTGVYIYHSDRIRVSWNVMNHIEKGVEVEGSGSALNKITNNTMIGGTYTKGKFGIIYSLLESSPTDDVVRNNLISKFNTGIIADTYQGYNKFNGNRIEYYDTAYVSPDATNEFKNNTLVHLTP